MSSEPVRSRASEFDASSLGPVTVKRLSDTIADQIKDLILSQDLKEGTRLPSERELAALFRTSRPTVSQALRSLALMGLVESRRGSGAYVLRTPKPADGPYGRSLLSPDAENLEELLELRLWLESLGVQQAVIRRTPAGMVRARRALERLTASVGEASTWIAADTVFHATMVDLAGNSTLTSIYEQVHNSVLEYEHRSWVDQSHVPDWLTRDKADAQLALHAPIVDAIHEGDLEGALAAVRRHNDVMREHLQFRGHESR